MAKRKHVDSEEDDDEEVVDQLDDSEEEEGEEHVQPPQTTKAPLPRRDTAPVCVMRLLKATHV